MNFLIGPCGRVRVTVPASGVLTIDAIPTVSAAAAPVMAACCEGGEPAYGNPVTLPVDAGEVWVEVGQTGDGPPFGPPIVVAPTVVARTSFTPR